MAPAGIVISQDIKILRTVLKLIDCIPLAIPTPIILPIKVWVVETGKPIADDRTTVIVALNVTENPLDGFKCVMLFPIVDMTFLP